jgi:magnesium transporter
MPPVLPRRKPAGSFSSGRGRRTRRIRTGRGRLRTAGADYLAYALIDSVVDGYFPVLESLGERLDELEAECITPESGILVAHIQGLRRDLLTVRRAVWPTREALIAIQRDESKLVTPETRVFLRDCYDHAVEAIDIIETDRETASSGSGRRALPIAW